MAKVTRITLENTGSGPDKRRLHLREISLNGDTPLESIGQDLRHAREKRGEDLGQISRVLKVRRDLLEAIEEGNIEALPGRAYAIGFVRSYAGYLGLDATNAVDRLKAEIAGRGDSKESPTVAPPAERRTMPSGTWIFGGLLILVLIYSGYYLIVSAGRMTSQPVIPVPERLAEQAGITAPSSAPAAEQPAPPATDPAASVTVRALPAPPAPAPAAVTPAPAPAPAAVAPPPPLPAGQKYGAQNAGSRITLRVHRPALVNVRGGDRVFMNRHLNSGDMYLVPNVVGLRLNTPDAGAVEVILDGSSVGFVGRDGADASNVSLNPNDVVDRQRRG